MRSITAIASCALLALPLVSLSAPARADSNDFMGQAKKFLNNDNNNNNATPFGPAARTPLKYPGSAETGSFLKGWTACGERIDPSYGPTGVVATACLQQEIGRNTGDPKRWVRDPTGRPRGIGRAAWGVGKVHSTVEAG